MTKKISELTELLTADNDDVLAIVDTSVPETKKIQVSNLRAAFSEGRNIIINGSGRINQRGYVSGTATVAANEFTIDRWFVIALGESLTFTGTDAGRVMTAPAGGVSTVIEGKNIVGGTYVISFTGTAACTVDGIAKSSGDTFTLTADTNATLTFSSGTFANVQVELGTAPTIFEFTDIGAELAKCQRYYLQTRASGRDYADAGGRRFVFPIFWPTEMRAAPSVTNTGGTILNATSITVGGIEETSAYLEFLTAAAASTLILQRVVTADAEITS